MTSAQPTPLTDKKEAVFPKDMQTADPSKIAKVYHTHLHDKAKCLYLCATCNIFCWDRVKNRAYVEVHENRLEMNYPIVYCCAPCCVCDNVSVMYFDKLGGRHFHAATCCTPYHCLCCVPFTGEVAATAKSDCCNHWCCFCFRHFIPGLPNAEVFSKAANAALEAFNNGKRDVQWMGSTPAEHAPPAQQQMPAQ